MDLRQELRLLYLRCRLLLAQPWVMVAGWSVTRVPEKLMAH